MLYLAFWIALFRTASSYIAQLAGDRLFSDEEELAVMWRDHLEANEREERNKFYADVVKASLWRM